MRFAKTIFEQSIHPSWIFYAAIWGIIIGIVGSFIFEIMIFNHWLWLVVAILILIFVLRHPTRIMLIFAIFSGMMIGNLRVAPEIIGRANLANLVGETVTLNGKIADDPVVTSGQVTVHLTHLELHLPRDELVEVAGMVYV